MLYGREPFSNSPLGAAGSALPLIPLVLETGQRAPDGNESMKLRIGSAGLEAQFFGRFTVLEAVAASRAGSETTSPE